MPAFDEMLVLEEKAQSLELEIGKARDFVRTSSRRLIDTKASLATIETALKNLKDIISTLRGHKAVLLSEWEQVTRLIGEHETQVKGKKLDIQKLEKSGKDTAKTIPGLEAQLAQVLKQLESYGQVIQFPHERTRTTEEDLGGP